MPLLAVDHLSTHFHTDAGVVRAVEEVSFSVEAGETLGIVGESGCGKSMTALSILGLVPAPAGRIVGGTIVYQREGEAVRPHVFPQPHSGGEGGTQQALPVGGATRAPVIDLRGAAPALLRQIRGNEIAMIFQEPMSALNPVMTIGAQIAEVLVTHARIAGAPLRERVIALLDLVGIPEPAARIDGYPHELSGGQRQRVMIAMAIACNPRLLIADEPTTALDVTIQAQILRLLKDLQARLRMALILITHDFGIVAEAADRVAVMYAGRIVETAGVREIFAHPRHPYTAGLMRAIPPLAKRPAGSRLATIPGVVPNLARLPQGCAFQDRCERVQASCRAAVPALETKAANHRARCFFPL